MVDWVRVRQRGVRYDSKVLVEPLEDWNCRKPEWERPWLRWDFRKEDSSSVWDE